MRQAPVLRASAVLVFVLAAGWVPTGLSLNGPGAIVLVACGWSAAVAVGLVCRRAWAREAGLLTFLSFVILTAPVAVGTIVGTATTPGVVPVILLAAGNVLAVVLLATPRAGLEVAEATIRDDMTERQVTAFRAWLEEVDAEDFHLVD